ncbi:MAG: hypothetical protein LQ337_003652 [Flavoplaca oasis]|nr:MAG: hypothetical protein LQ337_003652 [Flavoplaca oasis]
MGVSQDAVPIGVDEDIFELGMNSLQATRLHNILKAALYKVYDTEIVESFLSKGFVYSHPTISSQCRALAPISSGNTTSKGYNVLSRTEGLMKTVDRHCKAITAISSAGPRKPEGRVVIVTGSTGTLGSNIVYDVAQDKSVALIYCLNRRASSLSDENGRQRRAFNNAGISFPTHLWSNLRMIDVRPRKTDLGLSPDVYAQLTQASYIVHNAWPMDFNRSIVSFEAQFEYLDNIILLALHNTSHGYPRVLFTSSIASVARYPSKAHEVLVPEARMDDPDLAAPFGYPEAEYLRTNAAPRR